MLKQDQIEEMQEWIEGIVATNNFLQENSDIEGYVAQAVELFSENKHDHQEIADYVRKNFKS